MRIIRPPHYSRMKSAIYIYYIGEDNLRIDLFGACQDVNLELNHIPDA